MRRTTRLLASLVLALAGLAVLPPPAGQAAAPRDTVTVAGYDDLTDLASDVVAGSPDNNLVFTYTATEGLTDGTIQVDLPAADWTTPVRAVLGFDGTRTEQGFFGPRPFSTAEETPEGFCTYGYRLFTDDDRTWSAYNTATARSLVVTHVTCAPGEQLQLRVRSLQAPASPGTYRFGVSVSDGDGVRRVAAPRLRVRPVPRIRLEITTNDLVPLGEPFDVRIRALRPNGRVDTTFDGLLALQDEDEPDCTFLGYLDDRFPITDGVVVLSVTLQAPRTHRLAVRDVAARAVPGVSDRFENYGDPTRLDCPVAFH